MNKNILAERVYDLVDGRVSWYSSLDHFKKFKSVVMVDFWNQTSSSGDWDGFFVQKIGNTRYLIMFSQVNQIWNGGGYKVYTGNPLASWYGYDMTKEEIWQIISDTEKELNEMYH